jgi:prepilin-type N-terminal cleavage/methylation domain-containing protein
MRGRLPVIPNRPTRRGFTAVEMSMVVTVIAILALLIIPLFQKQTDEARIAAAEGDIREFAISMQLANAHTGFFFTLSSLDNTENYTTVNIDPTLDVPVVTWNHALTPAERAALAPTATPNERAQLATGWQGPYASFRRTITPIELDALKPNTYFRGGPAGSPAAGTNGPINQQFDAALGAINFSSDRLPLDPWGNPYLFYGPDYYHPPNGSGGLVAETHFRNSLFVSFGPNGLPGDAPTFDAVTLMRESGVVGTGDDIFRIM